MPLKPKELTPARRGALPIPRPILYPVDHIERRTRKVDKRIRIVKMERADEFFMLERQNDLEDRGDSGRGCEMADIGFHGADPAKLFS